MGDRLNLVKQTQTLALRAKSKSRNQQGSGDDACFNIESLCRPPVHLIDIILLYATPLSDSEQPFAPPPPSSHSSSLTGSQPLSCTALEHTQPPHINVTRDIMNLPPDSFSAIGNTGCRFKSPCSSSGAVVDLSISDDEVEVDDVIVYPSSSVRGQKIDRTLTVLESGSPIIGSTAHHTVSITEDNERKKEREREMKSEKEKEKEKVREKDKVKQKEKEIEKEKDKASSNRRGSKSLPKGGRSSESNGFWTCSTCTCVNASYEKFCEACLLPFSKNKNGIVRSGEELSVTAVSAKKEKEWVREDEREMKKEKGKEREKEWERENERDIEAERAVIQVVKAENVRTQLDTKVSSKKRARSVRNASLSSQDADLYGDSSEDDFEVLPDRAAKKRSNKKSEISVIGCLYTDVDADDYLPNPLPLLLPTLPLLYDSADKISSIEEAASQIATKTEIETPYKMNIEIHEEFWNLEIQSTIERFASFGYEYPRVNLEHSDSILLKFEEKEKNGICLTESTPLHSNLNPHPQSNYHHNKNDYPHEHSELRSESPSQCNDNYQAHLYLKDNANNQFQSNTNDVGNADSQSQLQHQNQQLWEPSSCVVFGKRYGDPKRKGKSKFCGTYVLPCVFLSEILFLSLFILSVIIKSY